MQSGEDPVPYGRIVRDALLWGAVHTLLAATLAAALTLLAAYRGGPYLVAALADLLFLAVLAMSAAGIRGVLRSRGCPERHWRVARWSLPWLGGASMATAALAAALTALSTVVPPLSILAACADAVFFWWLLVAAGSIYDVLHHVAVLPYFESPVGEIDTFCHGQALARRMVELDDRARALGVAPLSEFGWNDDLAGEPLAWHEAAGGLKTVNALLVDLQGDELSQAEPDGVVDDLKRIAHALARADERGIRFCLLLRHGNTTSGHEWDVRKGTCF